MPEINKKKRRAYGQLVDQRSDDPRQRIAELVP